MKDSIRGLYRSAHKRAVVAIAVAAAAALLVNLAFAILSSWPSYREYRSMEEQLTVKQAEWEELSRKPIAEQASNRDIDRLLAAIPLKLQLSAMTGEVMEMASRSQVLFVRLSQGQGQAAGSASAPSTSANGDAAAPSSGTEANAGTVSGVLVPHVFQTTVYGDMLSLRTFLDNLSKSDTFFTVNQVAFAKIEAKDEGDLSSLLLKLPHWREGLPAYSMDLTLAAFTLPESYQESFKDWEKGQTTAWR
ncbi:hypothetical protein [Gorillibacterium timonense]|uniref:hypothetical protein n=1 Tax=Gorillibacterium timonense TaxID=1689269 RepID=UPI00071D97DB|nr:hypothetical protein [Gorillibacterium timonense]